MSSAPRLVAALLSLAVGTLTLVAVLGVSFANAFVDRGFGSISASDAALLDEVVLLVPVIAIFGAIVTAGGVALLVGMRWARPVVAVLSGTAFIAGVVGGVALALGYDPFVAPGHGSTADGIGIVAVAAAIQLAILVSLAFDRSSVVERPRPVA
jgi:hypothetical protein